MLDSFWYSPSSPMLSFEGSNSPACDIVHGGSTVYGTMTLPRLLGEMYLFMINGLRVTSSGFSVRLFCCSLVDGMRCTGHSSKYVLFYKTFW